MKGGPCGKISACRGRKTGSSRVSAYSAKVGTWFCVKNTRKTSNLPDFIAPFGPKTLTLGGLRLGCRPTPCRFGRRLPPFSEVYEHGQSGHHQGQARVLGRHRLLLRRQEELAHHDRQAGQEEVRSGRAQARRIPRSQDQVRSRDNPDLGGAFVAPFLFWTPRAAACSLHVSRRQVSHDRSHG